MSERPRVLVVDDEPAVRSFTERALQEQYDVVTAGNGAEALQITEQRGPFDLYVIDLIMPAMRGDELARRLRLAHPDIKVLYFTGYSDALFKEKGSLWENEAFIDKPVGITGLLEASSLLLFGHTRGPSSSPA